MARFNSSFFFACLLSNIRIQVFFGSLKRWNKFCHFTRIEDSPAKLPDWTDLCDFYNLNYLNQLLDFQKTLLNDGGRRGKGKKRLFSFSFKRNLTIKTCNFQTPSWLFILLNSVMFRGTQCGSEKTRDARKAAGVLCLPCTGASEQAVCITCSSGSDSSA